MIIKQINNLSNEIYHNSTEHKDYWSSSNLKEYPNTPREAYYQKYVAPSKTSHAMDLGSCMHDFLASKHVKGQPFGWNVFEPPINHTTGKYYGVESQKYKDAVLSVIDPISADDMELINDIWQIIIHSDYRWFFEQEILSKGIAEASFFVDGLHKYKYRPDVVTDKFIFDYKTITKKYWNVQGLKYQIEDRGYDISASFYQYFEHQRTGIWKPFYIIWLMKDPPFDILISDISEYCFEPNNGEPIVNSGAMVFKKLKDQHEACQLTGHYPGLANQFDAWNGLRVPKFSPRYDRGFNEFELEND